MKIIQLTKGFVAFVDDEDYEKINKYSWYYSHGYALTNSPRIQGKRYKIYMHHLVMNVENSQLIDHINGDRWDNQKHNLRLCTCSENLRNSNKRSNCSSQYKGVYWNKKDQRWQVSIKFEDKKYYLGNFISEEEAALAYNNKAKELFGEFALLNELETAPCQ